MRTKKKKKKQYIVTLAYKYYKTYNVKKDY